MGFLEVMTSVEMFRNAAMILAQWPLLLNMVEGTIKPTVPVAEAHKIGFGLIIHPLPSLAPAYGAIKSGFKKLRNTGRMGTTQS